MLFAFYFFIEQLGMVIPAMLLIFILMIFAGYRRWGLMLFMSIFCTDTTVCLLYLRCEYTDPFGNL